MAKVKDNYRCIVCDRKLSESGSICAECAAKEAERRKAKKK
jgi:uncharacterized protein (UPF0305 family)